MSDLNKASHLLRFSVTPLKYRDERPENQVSKARHTGHLCHDIKDNMESKMRRGRYVPSDSCPETGVTTVSVIQLQVDQHMASCPSGQANGSSVIKGLFFFLTFSQSTVVLSVNLHVRIQR